MDFSESFFGFGNLDEGSFTGTETLDKDKAIVKSINTSTGFSNPLSMHFRISFSFSGSFSHSSVGSND